MIQLNDNRLIVRFPEVHEDALLSIDFQRTLRIPDDDKNYPLDWVRSRSTTPMISPSRCRPAGWSAVA